MTDRSSGTGWWKASDGRWYPPPRPADAPIGQAPDAPRSAVQPHADAARRVSWPSPKQTTQTSSHFGSTATMDASAVGGGPIHEPTVDLTGPIPPSASMTTTTTGATTTGATTTGATTTGATTTAPTTATAVSRASFGWRPDEKPPTPPTKPGKAAKVAKSAPANSPKPGQSTKAKSRKPGKATSATKPVTAAAIGKPGTKEPTTGLKQPIGARGALLTVLGAVMVIGGGVVFWIGHDQGGDDVSAGTPAPITSPVASSTPPNHGGAQPPFSAPAPTTPVSAVTPDTLAGQAAEFERSIGPSGLADLANYRSALTALGDAIPLENGDPATYGTRVQNAAGDVVSTSITVVRALNSASVGPLVQPYVSDVRRTLDQVSAASKIVTGCDPTKPCGPDLLAARTTQQDAQLAATVLDSLTP